jgi:predicted esterase
MGMKMPSWYDFAFPKESVADDDIEAVKDQANQSDLLKSVELLKNLIDHEISLGIPPKNIVIGGFS